MNDDPTFLEPEADHTDDELGYPWDCDIGASTEVYSTENNEE